MRVSSQVNEHPAHRVYAWQGASEAGVPAVHLRPSVRCRPQGLSAAETYSLAVLPLARSHVQRTVPPRLRHTEQSSLIPSLLVSACRTFVLVNTL